MKHQQRPIIVDAVETEEQRGERVWKEICDRTEFIAAEVALQTQMLADSCREEFGELMTRLGYSLDEIGNWTSKK